MKLENKVAVITGSSSGMGADEAVYFAREGASVVVVGRNTARIQEVVERIHAEQGSATGIAADITTPEGCETLIREAMEAYGRVDILVNNAGVFDKYAKLLDTSEELWESIFNINVTAVFRLCKLVLPQMMERHSGSIVNIASVAGLVANKGGAAYTASKHAVIGLTKHLSSAYAMEGVKINCICPGTIVTPLISGFVDTIPKDNVPMRRFGTTEEVAELAAFLASDEARFMSGSIIPIDGGYTVQ